METITRAEHLAWCKKRALAYLPGDPAQALISFISDMNKHEETRSSIKLPAGPLLTQIAMVHITNRDIAALSNWINGWN